MSTRVSLESALVERVLLLSGKRRKTDAVTLALQEFVARRHQGRLLELMSKLTWDVGFDHKSERSRS